MPAAFQFVLLRHQVPAGFGRPSHWDLLLEREENCWTWALETLPQGLSEDGPPQSAALRLPDHRKHYLTHEGPLSDGRGHVQRVLAAEYEWLAADADCIEVRLHGLERPLTLLLTRLEADHWQLQVR